MFCRISMFLNTHKDNNDFKTVKETAERLQCFGLIKIDYITDLYQCTSKKTY